MLHVARLLALGLLISTTSCNIVWAQSPPHSRPMVDGLDGPNIQPPIQTASTQPARTQTDQNPGGSTAAIQATTPTTSANPLLAPLGEQELFFVVPFERNAVANAVAKTSKTDDKKRQEVRLLGAVRVGQLESDELHAILKVDGQQIYRRIGDRFGDVEVVDIGRHSVTLQSDGERWTIELFEQPIINTKEVSSRPSSTSNRNSRPLSHIPAQVSTSPQLVDHESLIPNVPIPSAPEVEPPKLPELDLPPDPPELPEL